MNKKKVMENITKGIAAIVIASGLTVAGIAGYGVWYVKNHPFVENERRAQISGKIYSPYEDYPLVDPKSVVFQDRETKEIYSIQYQLVQIPQIDPEKGDYEKGKTYDLPMYIVSNPMKDREIHIENGEVVSIKLLSINEREDFENGVDDLFYRTATVNLTLDDNVTWRDFLQVYGLDPERYRLIDSLSSTIPISNAGYATLDDVVVTDTSR